MIFYSAGGFPFDDDMKPTLNTPAGQYAVDIYLQDKKARIRKSAGWGTPQMIPRIAQGHVVSCQYWDGTAKLNENPEKSKTLGKCCTAWCRARISPASGCTARSRRRSPRS